MRKTNSSQLKTLSEFFNMLSVAWFTAGAITPFFVGQNDITGSIILGGASIVVSLILLLFALILIRKIKL